MNKPFDEIWSSGFETGQRALTCRCPFPYHSPEAEAWESGWMQGLLKREGLAYRDHPLSQGSARQEPESTRERRWRK
jgi:hypothetical protein